MVIVSGSVRGRFWKTGEKSADFRPVVKIPYGFSCHMGLAAGVLTLLHDATEKFYYRDENVSFVHEFRDGDESCMHPNARD